jgi:hypothetical protein
MTSRSAAIAGSARTAAGDRQRPRVILVTWFAGGLPAVDI